MLGIMALIDEGIQLECGLLIIVRAAQINSEL